MSSDLHDVPRCEPNAAFLETAHRRLIASAPAGLADYLLHRRRPGGWVVQVHLAPRPPSRPRRAGRAPTAAASASASRGLVARPAGSACATLIWPPTCRYSAIRWSADRLHCRAAVVFLASTPPIDVSVSASGGSRVVSMPRYWRTVRVAPVADLRSAPPRASTSAGICEMHGAGAATDQRSWRASSPVQRLPGALDRRPFVLVHQMAGAWWPDDLARHRCVADATTFVITQTGVAERAHLLPGEIGASTPASPTCCRDRLRRGGRWPVRLRRTWSGGMKSARGRG